MSTLDIVGLCGSLRAASWNRMVLKLAATSDILMKSGTKIWMAHLTCDV
jgi:hypothetical protein